ncbi:MAG: threonine ammonia-lyase [Anaerococcus sp.]|nr:threonine ammonia-lyase [Anaerococcus sp.]MDD7045402.1 threonine ammonia-lyase [Peptoniphilaceae bacterium]MDY2919477.1 threonine ammonia-lyase [Anaerococcus sp.]
MELNLDSIKEARSILEGNIEKTPIYTASRMNDNLYIKMENLQKTGSFKLRGAFNKIAHLTEEEAKRGVISCSAGNHAQGVALSATKQGIKSYICIPSVAPLSKIEATRGYGGEVIIVDGTFDDAQKRAFELEKERNLTYVAPFDDEYVIAGQGTIGLEILEQLPDVKYIVVPIGGGGLISGIALAVKSIKPDVKIIGVEPENAASMYESRKAGKLVTLDSVKTMADGIAVKRPGNITFDLVEKYVDDIVTVSEDEITNAILRLLEESKVAAEGAGASSIAAVLHGKYDFSDGKVCAVLSGGNININTISQIINQGLFKTGRLAEITTIISDNPGELIRLLTIIKDLGANIMAIDQFKSSETVGFDHAVVRIIAETYNKDHRRKLYKTLADKGYKETHAAESY